jgi:hypothetical protein
VSGRRMATQGLSDLAAIGCVDPTLPTPQ